MTDTTGELGTPHTQAAKGVNYPMLQSGQSDRKLDHRVSGSWLPAPASPRPAALPCVVVTIAVAGASGCCEEILAVLTVQCVTRKRGVAPVGVGMGGSKYPKLNCSQKRE